MQLLFFLPLQFAKTISDPPGGVTAATWQAVLLAPLLTAVSVS